MPARTLNLVLTAAAVFALYLIAFFVLGPMPFGPAGYYWFSSGISLAASYAALRLALASRTEHRPFFLVLGFSMLMQALQMTLYLQEHDLLKLAYGVANTLFHFTLVCAWALLALGVVRAIAPLRAVTRVLALVLLGLAALYVLYLTQIHPAEGAEFSDVAADGGSEPTSEMIEQRFRIVGVALDALGLFFGLLVVILGARGGYVLAVIGVSVYAGSNFVFFKLEDLGAGAQTMQIQPIWDLGTLLVLIGLTTLATGEAGRTWKAPDSVLGEGAAARSGLSALLASLTLGAIFVPASVAFALEQRHEWLLFFYLIFCVGSLVFITRLTLGFDRVVAHCREQAHRLMVGRLRIDNLPSAKAGIWRLLELTRLDELLESLEQGAEELRQDVLFLGPDRLYGTVAPRPPRRTISCFVVMPFSASWSDEVHLQVRRACREAGVHPVRGDDLFTPGNFVEDIWQQINDADFIIADITGHNANVFYELGIAHAIAKPVLILTQSVEDLPADLATLRVLSYEAPDVANDWPRRIRESLGPAIGEVQGKFGLNPTPAVETEAERRAP